MLAPTPTVLLALALFVGAPATAQLQAGPCAAGTRRIELKEEPQNEVPELCISPELSTTLLFHGAELLGGGVTVEGRERFALVDSGSTTLRLMPSERVVPGDRFRLTVRFKDGAAPASAAFWLVVYAGRVEPWVEVYRQKRTVETCEQEVKEKDAQLRQCQAANARLLAEKESPEGMTGLLATGFMDSTGIRAERIRDWNIVPRPGTAAGVMRVITYRSKDRVAVEVILEPTPGMPPWRVVGVDLVEPGRRTLRVKPPWQSESLSVGTGDWRVVIEADATEAEARGRYTLKLWGAEGTRSVVISGVTFP